MIAKDGGKVENQGPDNTQGWEGEKNQGQDNRQGREKEKTRAEE